MPIPVFQFDNTATGTPRQPVPVRFACLTTGWGPRMFAEFVTGPFRGLSAHGIGDLDRIYLYNDDCIPTDSAGDMGKYLKRLAILAKLEIK